MNYRRWICESFDRSGDVALVTGGTSGIGREYLNLLAAEGCNCIVVSNEVDRLATIASEMYYLYKVSVYPMFCDFANYDEIIGLSDKLVEYEVRILVNCAGYGLKGDFLSKTESEYKDIVSVNSLAPALIARMILPKMRKKNSGLVISVATINVVSPIPGNAMYTATKFFAWAYSLAMVQENSDANIMFQTMLPGTTDTPFHEKQGAMPKKMMMSPKDVAYRSLSNLDSLIYIPNTFDKMAYLLSHILPIRLKMKIAAKVMKIRLGL